MTITLRNSFRFGGEEYGDGFISNPEVLSVHILSLPKLLSENTGKRILWATAGTVTKYTKDR